MKKNGQPQPFWAYMGLGLMTAIIGLSFIFLKVGLQYSNPIDLLAHRFTAAAIATGLLWMCGFIKLPRLNYQKTKSLLLLSLFYPLLFFSLQTFGMQFSSASEAGIVFATTPIITLIAAGVFLKEKTLLLQKIGIALSVAGIVYIVYHSGNLPESSTVLGIVILMLSVFSMVAYYMLGKKISTGFSAIEITVWMIVVAFVAFNAWSIFNHLKTGTLNNFFSPLLNTQFLWAVLYLGVLSSLLTAFLTNFALSHVPASQIGVFNNISPIIAIVGGVVFLRESLYLYHIIGGVLVLAGIILVLVFKEKERLPVVLE